MSEWMSTGGSHAGGAIFASTGGGGKLRLGECPFICCVVLCDQFFFVLIDYDLSMCEFLYCIVFVR
jgi:hypothetical protein